MNLPNKITIFRICMIPVFVISMLVSFPFHELIALIVFIIAAVSDSIDGHLARSRGLVTDFGKFMDPLADKLLVCSAFIVLVELSLMPSWVVIIIIAREFAITGLRTLAAADNIVIAASKWGKAKTISQMLAIVILLLYNWPVCQIKALEIAGTVMIYVAAVLTLISGVDYFIKNKKVIKSF